MIDLNNRNNQQKLGKWMKRSEEAMAESKKDATQKEALPEDSDSIEAFWTFWDTHTPL